METGGQTARSELCVVVQAGGRGSRLRHHTWNKPKCLVSVRGKPILYHLFDRFPTARFILIGDYLFDKLARYLEVNPPPVRYELLSAQGKGTASGIAEALSRIGPNVPVVLAWSDLIIYDLPPWPEGDRPTVCTTSAFTCRWSVGPQGQLQERPSATNGIPGLFYFPRASSLPPPPEGGEFVKWFAKTVGGYSLLDCPAMDELGDFSSIEASNDREGFCRFFNDVKVGETQVVKRVIDPNYENVHAREIAWYDAAQRLGFRRIPKIHSLAPLTMERIRGEHAYRMADLTPREQRAVLADYLDSLIALHDKGSTPGDPAEAEEAYLRKTIQRVNSVAGIIPGIERESMTINGRKCRNLFSWRQEGVLHDIVSRLQPPQFTPIHGDPTFSNTLVDDKLRVWFFDPRGYFAKPGIFGDPRYDFAKVYYSAVGGYDAFNRRKFKLHVDEETVEVLMEEPLFMQAAIPIFAEYFGDDLARIELLHGLIWLALSGYTKDDVDSMIGAFYLGLYWLEAGMARL